MNSASSRETQQTTAIVVVAVAQLFGTSLWFSINAAADDIIRSWGITASDIGFLTSAVQLGFILGTLILALTGLADRFQASKIFLLSSILGALLNLAFAFFSHGLTSAIVLRFFVGLSLAGIYPLGMKLIVSWVANKAGAALSLLVAMLTLGTALPHALRSFGASLSWQSVIAISSGLALLGAVLVGRLGDGPNVIRKSPGTSTRQPSVLSAFKLPRFRAAAWGYFGHMWELYAFWALIPSIISNTGIANTFGVAPSWLAFAVIAAGTFGCVLGGKCSERFGNGRVALIALTISGSCCLAFALLGAEMSHEVQLAILLVWGISVIADSPQFSALAVKNCPPALVGGGLAIQNSLGFALTVGAISLTSSLFERWGLGTIWVLVPGPIIGLICARRLWKAE